MLKINAKPLIEISNNQEIIDINDIIEQIEKRSLVYIYIYVLLLNIQLLIMSFLKFIRISSKDNLNLFIISIVCFLVTTYIVTSKKRQIIKKYEENTNFLNLYFINYIICLALYIFLNIFKKYSDDYLLVLNAFYLFSFFSIIAIFRDQSIVFLYKIYIIFHILNIILLLSSGKQKIIFR